MYVSVIITAKSKCAEGAGTSQEEWFNRFGSGNVYINENLTTYRAGLFKKVRDRRRRDWKFWTIDGKIFVKPDPIRDVIVRVQNEEDLKKL